jgi:Fe-S-cluster containining protein
MRRDQKSTHRLRALTAKADAEFDAVHRRQASHMQCRPGCSDCCRARLSITRVEEAALRQGLATLPESRRAQFAARTVEPGREMCPALDDDGRCGVYEFRPLICRTFGAPLRHRHAVELVNPPIIDSCDLNFTEYASLRVLPTEDVLDQTRYVEELDAIDRDHCTDGDLPQAERIPLASILAGD